MHCIKGKNYEINISAKDNGAVIENGKFGDAVILKTPLFYMRLKNIETEENVLVDSSKLWESVKVKKIFKNTEFVFENPNGVKDITVFVCAESYKQQRQHIGNGNNLPYSESYRRAYEFLFAYPLGKGYRRGTGQRICI